MIILSPTAQFQKACPQEALALAEAIPSKWMAAALTHAFAQMASDGKSKEELAGAKYFIEKLINLAEEEKPAEFKDNSQLNTYD